MAAVTDSHLDRYLSRVLSGYRAGTVHAETDAFAAALDSVARENPDIAAATIAELRDQRSKLKLIASENFASPAVLLVMGNWLSDKYAEGVPGHRFYAGCDHVDAIESRAVELARELFRAEHVYAQPHSGIDANLVAFWAVLTAHRESAACSAAEEIRSGAHRRRMGSAASRSRRPEDDGHGARCGRASHARFPSERLGQAVQVLQLRSRCADRSHRLFARATPRVGGETIVARRRLQLVPAPHRLREVQRDRG